MQKTVYALEARLYLRPQKSFPSAYFNNKKFEDYKTNYSMLNGFEQVFVKNAASWLITFCLSVYLNVLGEEN